MGWRRRGSGKLLAKSLNSDNHCSKYTTIKDSFSQSLNAKWTPLSHFYSCFELFLLRRNSSWTCAGASDFSTLYFVVGFLRFFLLRSLPDWTLEATWCFDSEGFVDENHYSIIPSVPVQAMSFNIYVVRWLPAFSVQPSTFNVHVEPLQA